MSSELLKAIKALPADSQRRIKVAAAWWGYSQTELATGAGIDDTKLSKALNGHKDLSDDEQEKVAAFLGVPVSLLFPEVAA